MRPQVNQAILLLGSNIRPETNLPKAIQLLAARFPVLGVSNVWETPAIGSEGPDFLNAAILLESFLPPQVMKEFVLRPLEASLGRVRTSDKNAPRTIDLDVVVWGQQTRDQDIWQFAHAAIPVAELMPDLHKKETGETLAQVAQSFRKEAKIYLRPELTQQIHAQLKAVFQNPAFVTNQSFPWLPPDSH